MMDNIISQDLDKIKSAVKAQMLSPGRRCSLRVARALLAVGSVMFS